MILSGAIGYSGEVVTTAQVGRVGSLPLAGLALGEV